MEEPEPYHFDARSDRTQVVRAPIGTPRKSQDHHRLLTLRAAMREFGLNQHQIYAAVERGWVHQVKPNGRTLYPEWEVAAIKALLTRAYTAAAAA